MRVDACRAVDRRPPPLQKCTSALKAQVLIDLTWDELYLHVKKRNWGMRFMDFLSVFFRPACVHAERFIVVYSVLEPVGRVGPFGVTE